MPRQKPSDKIDTLRRQQAEIASKLKDAEAKARSQKRENEQRRERLAGRCILAELDQQPDSPWGKATLEILSHALTRPDDRKLFSGLALGGAASLPPGTPHEAQGEAFAESAG